MKLTELRAIEAKLIGGLRQRAASGDNEAAKVLLEHLRAISKAISEWQEKKPKKDETQT